MSHVISRPAFAPESGDPKTDVTTPAPNDVGSEPPHSAEVLEAHRTYLLKVAHDLLKPELRPKVSPSDLVQESIVIAIRKFQSFHGSSQQQLRAWLESILRHKYCNFQRIFYRNARHAIRREVSIDAVRSESPGWEIPAPESVGTHRQADARLALIRQEVRKLSPAEAEVFTLRMEHDMPVAEIAAKLQISQASVHKRYQRAIRHLYERLHQRVDSDSEMR